MATTSSQSQTAAKDRDLTGRVAMVTGGTRGIGAAICHALAADGAVVAAGYSSNRARADELRQSVEADGGTAVAASGQHRRRGGLRARRQRGDREARPAGHPRQQRGHHGRQAGLEDVRGRLGQGAAGGPLGSLLHVQARDRAHDRARLGADHQHLLGDRRDRQHRPGELRGLEVRPVRAHQDARPRGGVRASGGRASSRRGIGVTVNCSHPRPDRDRHGRHDPAVHGGRRSWSEIPMHRMGQPDEIARVVSFLAQDASGYITGQIWGVNGGIDM